MAQPTAAVKLRLSVAKVMLVKSAAQPSLLATMLTMPTTCINKASSLANSGCQVAFAWATMMLAMSATMPCLSAVMSTIPRIHTHRTGDSPNSSRQIALASGQNDAGHVSSHNGGTQLAHLSH